MNFVPREHAVHMIVAATRFPGPDYYEVLRWLHEELRPERYVEIGVMSGRSLRLAAPSTIALGIDPFPELDRPRASGTRVLSMTSSDFFAKHTLAEYFGTDRFSFAFVDGSHQFQHAIGDIFSLERYAEPQSIIAIHDTLPLDEETAARVRHTTFYTGDVWKVVPFLKQHRPDLELITVRTAPSGLTLIRRLNASRTRFQPDVEGLRRFEELPWEYYKRHRDGFLETLPNDREAVMRWLRDWARPQT